MKQKVISLSDSEMNHLKNRSLQLEIPVNEYIRRWVSKDMMEFPVDVNALPTKTEEPFNLKKTVRSRIRRSKAIKMERLNRSIRNLQT